MIFGVIAVLADFFIYGFFASVPATPGLPESHKGPLIIRLIAGLALFYLVAHVFSRQPESNPSLSMSPEATLIMLLGFLCAAIAEAYRLVLSRKDKNNKMLWRVVALWGMWFSVAAIFGALYTLIRRIDARAFAP